MKRIQFILTAIVLIATASCSSTRNTSSTPDDVYYSAGDPQSDPQPASAVDPAPDYSRDNSNYNPDNGTNYSQSPSSTEQHTDGQGNTYITNNYNNDDYYDYEYSARLRRYYTPAVGYGYYDPFYTNSYWYDYNPYNYGVSIYLGYNWWAPPMWYYTPFYYGAVYAPYYHPYYGYYDPWYSPCGYYGFNNYPYGYNHGYNDGYWNGYYSGAYASAYNNPYYYNSYEGNSVYYGPRGSISSNVGTTSPSPRATLGEKYQQSKIEQVAPVMNPSGKVVTQTPVSGTGRSNTITTVETGKPGVSTVNPRNDIGATSKAPLESGHQSISDKNLSGTRPTVDPSSYSTPVKGNTSGVDQTPRNGGNIRPEIDQPSRSNNINYSRPKNFDVTVSPQNNNGGTVKPGIDQSGINQDSRPSRSQPRNSQLNQHGNSDNTIGQPRNENSFPRNTSPQIEQRVEQPRVNPSYERPRQEVQPRVEPRQEPRQYKQEHSQPRQNENFSTPTQRQPNMNSSSPRNNSSSGESKSGGRRK